MLLDAQPAVDDLVRRRVDTGVVPAVAYTVFASQGIVFAGCHGAAGADGRPPTTGTAFRIASCTKSFTAAALLQLRDAGKVNLEDPITDYVGTGAWQLPGGHAPPPSVGALLSMSGGLATDNPWADRQESMPEHHFTALCQQGFTLIAAPGARYEYSNLGYALLGRVIARASGIGYRQYVIERLLKPLGLAQTGFDAATAQAPDGVADGFRFRCGQWQPVEVSGPGAFSSIGGLYSTAADLAAWCGWLASAYPVGAPEDPILAPSSRRQMQHLRQVDPSRIDGTVRAAGYGYGLEVELYDCGTIVSHRGGYPGFSAQMAWHPATQVGVVILENAPYAQSPAVTVLRQVLSSVKLPAWSSIWPMTAQARSDIERLLVRWDDTLADRIFADNMDRDQPRRDRRKELTRAAAAIDFTEDGSEKPLVDCHPVSRSPAHLEWTVHGRSGALRCEVALTSHVPPRIQSVSLRRMSTPDASNCDVADLRVQR
jgi:CubicO group peptidase (beta-lactamase class C family)